MKYFMMNRGDGDGPHAGPRGAGLAGAPGRAARGRAADRRRRLQRPAQLLAGRAGRRRADRADRASGCPTARSRRTSPRSSSAATRWRSAGRSAAGSSGGRRARAPVLLVGRRLGHRPADGHDPRAPAGGQPGAVPAALLAARPRPPLLRRRTAPPRRRAGRRLPLHRGPSRTTGRARPAASCWTTWPKAAGPPTSSRTATSAARPASSRRRPTCCSHSGTRPSTSGPNASAPPEADMTTEHLDGNALAGPLGEIFAVDVTAAVGRCASCGLTGPIAAPARLRPRTRPGRRAVPAATRSCCAWSADPARPGSICAVPCRCDWDCPNSGNLTRPA